MESGSASEQIRASIVALMRKRGNRVLSIKEIHRRLEEEAGGSVGRDEVERAVESMERSGELIAVRGKRYSLIEFTPNVAGPIRISPDGYGTVLEPSGERGVHVDRRSLRGAMNGDVVVARILREGSPKMVRGRELLRGEVTRILRREHSEVVGRFHQNPVPFIRPFDARLDEDIEIVEGETLDAREGEMVVVAIEDYPSRQSAASGRVIERLGMLGDPGVDIEVVIRKLRIPHEFPDDVLREADAIRLDVPQEEIERRVDLRDLDIVTIDGETAKDFDDAVEVRELENGNWLLGVHIADVSHYVREGTALDREAYERGTSVYFPGRAVPMLPERLSNGICSLNPRVDRLTFSATVEIDRKGRFVNRDFFRSVIRTRERLTYTDVHALLTERPPDLAKRYADVLPLLERMNTVFEILRNRREKRGSIDFDLPEAEVLLTEAGEIEAIEPLRRNMAHRLIEEFMLVANELVAQQLFFAQQPAVYRIHQPPDFDRIEDLREILAEFRFKLRGDAEEMRPGELQRILRAVEGTPEERFLTELVLRAMKRAMYSDENIGHFALALQHYLHFTSPIRRYPDLVVHRQLGRLLDHGSAIGDEADRLATRVAAAAVHSTARERRAEEAEREVLEWKKVIYMRDKVGERFAGRVTGVMPFGLFVELDEIFVQGLVPVASIGGDFWNFLERQHRLRGESSGREFRLGDPVVIEVKEVDEDRRQIEFRLVAASGEEVDSRASRRRRVP